MIRILFKEEDDDYKPTRLGILGITIILNMKVTVAEIKKLSVKEYLDKIIPYLKDIIFDLQNLAHGKFSEQYQLTLLL